MYTQANSRIVVVGNGMVGYKFCEKLRASENPARRAQLTVFGEEPRPAYDRVHLSDYVAGASADALALAPPDWYADNGITLHVGDPVVAIDRARKLVRSHRGRVVPYDFLVLATGSGAFVPAIPGVEKDGVFVYRTLEDLDLIKAHARLARAGAVLGGGLLGLEAAKALLDLGLTNAHVVEFAPRLMPRQLDAAGAAVLAHRLEALGVQLHLGKQTTTITGTDVMDGLTFADGTRLAVDLLVISAGIRPRDELAQRSGLAVHPRGGIVVDDTLQTADPAIFAIGECALVHGQIWGLVAPGYDMADVVASRLTGTARHFAPYDLSTKLKLIGVDVASFGDAFADEPAGRSIVYENRAKSIYKRINVSADGKTLLGGMLVGDADAYPMLLQTCKNRTVLPPEPESLILGARGADGGEAAGVMSLPNDALICSCEAITKGRLCHEIGQHGHHSVDALKKSTKAGTGCGGCVPLVNQLVQGVLAEQGVYVRNVVCEHFDHSRQELLDLIKLHDLRTYGAVLDRFGRGHGCEVCKPVVASLLASLWNENVLTADRAPIQDSNDRFLANIQKGGTYSVVPRIPGGEITPDKLIALGQVAKRYGLYTKITGGQRIDLFGAHVGDLPAIWEELIAAGFESGHAYGKALRTVKSCVGSTWCRFGVQDSVSFAIEIEERYKGIRAPHKLKSGVSGCVRECAEAQSKDFGLIATEKGWNIYVGGNGGANPQHAQLLATDVDRATCIRLLDRFLMFYIRTADPLTRTATWLNKLDGGLAYLRAVVVDDVLGVADELEREMQRLVDKYACEWRAVVETPALRRQFAHFVNAPAQKDPSVQFTPLRSQKQANPWN